MSVESDSSLEFVIDNREHALIEKLQELKDEKKINTNIDIKTEQLDVGDILYRQNGETVLIVERKTVIDLKASICDGRGREQKARLLGTVPRHRILYLVEGNMNRSFSYKISGLPVSTLLGSIINTQLRDGIKVYKTASLEETAYYLTKLYEKLLKDGGVYFCDEESKSLDNNYTSSLKKSKKANMTPNVWFCSSLSLIPQVTEKVASVIIEKYPTMRDLCLAYENTDEKLRAKLLANITFELKNGKARRLGDKMSERIYNFFFANKEKL